MYVYADNAATTAMSKTAIRAMEPYYDTLYGNPSSLHSVGQRAAEALEAARQALALSPEDGRIRDNVAFLAG